MFARSEAQLAPTFPETVHQAGVSVRGKVGASEVNVPDKDLEDHIVSWPLKWPKAARRKP